MGTYGSVKTSQNMIFRYYNVMRLAADLVDENWDKKTYVWTSTVIAYDVENKDGCLQPFYSRCTTAVRKQRKL